MTSKSFDRYELMQYIWTSKEIRSLYLNVLNRGFSEDFPDEELENTARFLRAVGIYSVDGLKSIIIDTSPMMDAFLYQLWEQHQVIMKRKWRVSFCFIVQIMLIHNYSDILSFDFLCSNGWDKPIAELVLKHVQSPV